MKFASEDLINEHTGILFGLQILEEMVRRLNSGQQAEIDDLKSIISFFKLFADQCHHGKEEGLYFPSLEAAGVKNEGGPIGQMLMEHAIGRNYIALMGKSIDRQFLHHDFSEAATGYIGLLRAHIEKENSVLFKMGDQLLEESEQARLLEAFEVFEEQVMGAGTHQHLHEMLDQFEQKYLP